MKKFHVLLPAGLAVLTLLVVTGCSKHDDDLAPMNDLKALEKSEVIATGTDGYHGNHGSRKAAAEALRGMLESYEAAINNRDFDAWISNWAEDGVQMPPNNPPRIGKDAIAVALEPGFNGPGAPYAANMTIDPIDDVVVMQGGKYGLTRCTYSFYVQPVAGGPWVPLVVEGKALTVFKKIHGEWKIAYDCFNSNLPPA
jgi:ketosteroid isomerase-like protein